MTQGTLKTKGTKLFFTDAAGSPQNLLRVACATGISGLGGAADQIDITCLDSEEREFVQGFTTPGSLSVPINFIPRSAAHQALMGLKESGDTVSWMILGSDQATEPTALDVDNRITSPGGTSAEFLGYVSDFTFDIGANDIWRGTLTIQRSGGINWTWPDADLP
jgi:hypothetical protein